MTSEVTDMSTPVTRGELRDELAQLESRLERKLDDKLGHQERKFDDKLGHLEHKFDDKLGHLEHKFDAKLDLWGGALLARIVESEKRVLSEIARHTQAVYESMTKQISVLDEKYRDLPERMARLEVEVHALKLR
jgi:DNA anti-recombination protein RmuC